MNAGLGRTPLLVHLLGIALGLAACGPFFGAGTHEAGSSGPRRERPPVPKRPTDPAGAALFDAAGKLKGRRIFVSLEDRWLWLVEGTDTLLAAPVAVGKNETFSYGGRTFRFETPRGRRTVRGKEAEPRWVPPDWHYYEIAAEEGLEAVHLRRGQRVALSDGTVIEVRGAEVGRTNRHGNWWPFTPGAEIIFDGKIFIPPFGGPQREVPRALGTHKLDLGDGYLIHGTYERDSVGRPVSHGCIRMRNEDVSKLFRMVDAGTPVIIF